eukprot:scaffold328748_cov909-Tisochrysis_lutea.AAC.1
MVDLIGANGCVVTGTFSYSAIQDCKTPPLSILAAILVLCSRHRYFHSSHLPSVLEGARYLICLPYTKPHFRRKPLRSGVWLRCGELPKRGALGYTSSGHAL